MDSRAWALFADKVLGALAADEDGLFADMRPEIERRLFEADPDKALRQEQQREALQDESGSVLESPVDSPREAERAGHHAGVELSERVPGEDVFEI